MSWAKIVISLFAIALLFGGVVVAVIFINGRAISTGPRVKPRIAVLQFETIDLSESDGRRVSELITTALVESNRFSVVERSALEGVLNEQRIQTAIVETDDAVRIGKLAGADAVLVGSIMRMSGRTESITISARIVDVERANVLGGKGITVKNEEDLPNAVRSLANSLGTIKWEGHHTPQEIPVQTPNAPVIAANKTILVVIPETVLRRNPPDPAAETEIIRQFAAAGYTVIDQSRISSLRSSDRLRQAIEGRTELIGEIGQEYQADYIIFGEAFAEETSGVSDEINTFRARAEVRMIRTADQVVIIAEGKHASGSDITPNIAAKQALTNAGGMIAEAFLPALQKELAK